jgi:hypothetical protein
MMNTENAEAVGAPVEPTVRPLRLRWHARKQPALGEELFAPVPAIEHSVGSAGYTVRQDMSGLWIVTWWHGNRGHAVESEMTEVRAKAAAQAHFDMLVSALLEPAA